MIEGRKLRMLDLFCGRFGWGRVFAAQGWEVVGIDLIEPPEIPQGCKFIKFNILNLAFSRVPIPHFTSRELLEPNPLWETTHFDFICASPPCENFSVHGVKMFHPNPPYPELGIKLFNHTRQLCEASGLPYIMENVKSAQAFVGKAAHHCGPFYLWGSGIPHKLQFGLFGENEKIPNELPRGIKKGMSIGSGTRLKGMNQEEKRLYRKQFPALQCSGRGDKRKSMTAKWATIPAELANCVAEYAENLIEQRMTA